MKRETIVADMDDHTSSDSEPAARSESRYLSESHQLAANKTSEHTAGSWFTGVANVALFVLSLWILAFLLRVKSSEYKEDAIVLVALGPIV